MKDKQKSTEPEPTPDEWVRVNPDQPVYQKLELCHYLAEFPGFGVEEAGGEKTA